MDTLVIPVSSREPPKPAPSPKVERSLQPRQRAECTRTTTVPFRINPSLRSYDKLSSSKGGVRMELKEHVRPRTPRVTPQGVSQRAR
ncbi:unnamed protein product [Echinostoma caproni]|uniref:Uncharacterized protein n=1 Tax=Echinostoma caproni TaxID=27848 RepID=A0A183B7B6_9TREM|nr:unnamed protein product [Echinostoma caproni]